MDNRLTPEAQNAVIDDALQTFPLAPMPRDLTGSVMARIRTIPAPRPFRISWIDFGITLVLSVCLAAIWISVQNIPPLLLAQIRMHSILFYQDLIVNARWLLPTVFFGLAALLSALTIPYLSRNIAAK